jgi:hypothetical protein
MSSVCIAVKCQKNVQKIEKMSKIPKNAKKEEIFEFRLHANTQFIYSNRDVYIAIALCSRSRLLHSAISAIAI